MSVEYNPLDKENLGISVRDALLKQEPIAFHSWHHKFSGAGIYALYYTGSFPAYGPIAARNRDGAFDQPIYVGKAVPAGARKGGIRKDDETAVTSLQARLREHRKSIQAARNLQLDDFYFRYLAVDDIWIPLGETYMIDTFKPLWNKIVDGFGIHTPGKRRKGQYTSRWDTLHPGRTFVSDLELPPNPQTTDQIIHEIERYLRLSPEQQASIPVKDGGGENEVQQDE